MYASAFKSGLLIEKVGVGVVTYDHAFTCDRIIPPVIIHMNIVLLFQELFYSGGLEGTGTIDIHLHNNMLEP